MIRSVLSVAVTHRGHLREKNEDSVLSAGQVISGPENDPVCERTDSFPVLYAVADGIGGSVAGEKASRTVLSFLVSLEDVPDTKEKIYSAVFGAKEVLDAIAIHDRSMTGLGTTVAGLVAGEDGVISFNTGDSRVYRIRADRCECLSHDHSLVQELYDCGMLTEDQVRIHPYRHIITSSISGDLTGREPLITIRETDWQEGDRFLLCTDGVWEITNPVQITDLVLIPDLSEAAGSILSHCLREGAPDNVSFIILAFGQ